MFVFSWQGERSFFLLPGERLMKGIQNVYVLGEDEGLILRATESFKDEDTVRVKIRLFSCKKSKASNDLYHFLFIYWINCLIYM